MPCPTTPAHASRGRRLARPLLATPLAALLSLASVAAAAPSFSLVDLGTLNQGTSAVVRGPNATGAAVGGGRLQQGASNDVARQGLLFRANGAVAVPGLPGSDFTTAFGINDAGTVVGAANTASAVRAFIASPAAAAAELAPLSADNASLAYAVNNQGQSVGFSSGAGGERAVTWSATRVASALPTPGASSSRAVAINIRGDAAGTLVRGGARQPALWLSGAAAQALPLLGGHAIGEATGVNARGDVVGYSATADEQRRATLWPVGGAPVDLGALPGGTASYATGINAAGDVVGASTSSQGSRAFLWTAQTGMQDLNALLVSPPAGLVLTTAVGINDTGAIVAVGHEQEPGHDDHPHDHEQPIRVFLLTRTGG